jgi:hypothetical protein
MKTVANKIASLIAARANCMKSGNMDWHLRHGEQLARIIRDCLPSGSGFDCGTTLCEEECRDGERLVFSTEFHHMDGHGGYDGWTQHKVTVYPSLVFGLDIRVSGRDRDGIKDYIVQCFHDALSAEWTE